MAAVTTVNLRIEHFMKPPLHFSEAENVYVIPPRRDRGYLPSVGGFYKARVEGHRKTRQQHPCLPQKTLHVQSSALFLSKSICGCVKFLDAGLDQEIPVI